MKANQAAKFLKLILLVVIKPPNAHILNQIQTLPQHTQQVIKDLIQQVDPLQSASDDDEAQEENGVDPDRVGSEDGIVYSSAQRVNRELEFEEQQAKLQSKLSRRERDVEILEAEKEDLDAAYQRLQESHEAMRIQSVEQENQLKRFTLAHNDMDQHSIRELEAKISQQEEMISSKEFRITEHQSLEAEQHRRISKLNAMADEFQKLQDEVYIQKAELLEQTKKANAGEKYKQKVQASQFIERDRDALRLQLEEARPRLKAYDDLRRDNARLIKENREISSTLSQSEIGNSELRVTKQGVVAENDRLRRDLRLLREAYAQGQENIANLEDGSSASEVHSSPTIVDGGLESELVATSKFEEQMQVSKILLQCLRGLTEDRKSRVVELERQNQELIDDRDEKESQAVILQQQLGYEAHPVEGSVPPTDEATNFAYCLKSVQTLKQIRDQLHEEQQKCDHLEKMLLAARKDAEAATNDRTSSFELHCMMLELNVDLLEGGFAGTPKVETTEGVNKSHSMSPIQVQSELDALKISYSHLEQSNRELKERNQAMRNSHEPIVRQVEGETRTTTNLQSFNELTEMIRQATLGESANTSASIEQTLGPLIERNREMVAEQQQVNKRLASLEQMHCSTPQPRVLSPLPSPVLTSAKLAPRRFTQPRALSPLPSLVSTSAKFAARRFFTPKDANIL